MGHRGQFREQNTIGKAAWPWGINARELYIESRKAKSERPALNKSLTSRRRDSSWRPFVTVMSRSPQSDIQVLTWGARLCGSESGVTLTTCQLSESVTATWTLRVWVPASIPERRYRITFLSQLHISRTRGKGDRPAEYFLMM